MTRHTNTAIPDFPALYLVRQKLIKSSIQDIGFYLLSKLKASGLGECIRWNSTVGIAVGSRGIGEIAEMVRILVDFIKERGGKPVIIPAMGSHGGACSAGQRKVLEHYGIIPEQIRADITAGMEVVDFGPTDNGLHAYFDRIADGCEMIVVINRIKEHTDFYGPTESGLMKMIAVGLGNDTGASYIHGMGSLGLSEYIPMIAARIIEQKQIFGIGIVEDGYGGTARIDVLHGREIVDKESEILDYARSNKAKLPFKKIDYLIIEEIGKNISGSGLDTKVVGRIRYPGVREPEKPAPDIITGLRLTPESDGNAAGVGLLDIISHRLYNAIDLSVTYENAKSSKSPERYKIPMHLISDYETIETGLNFSRIWPSFKNRIVLIRNTSKLEIFYATEELLNEATDSKLEMVSNKPIKLYFDPNHDYISLFPTD